MVETQFVKNRKASYEYIFIDTLTAGINLTGAEVKAIRKSQISIASAHCYFKGNELFLKNANIANIENPNREKKLLLTKKEITKWKTEIALNQGYTVVPTKVVIGRWIKIDLALAKGKKLHDKRESIKKKDIERENSRL